MTAGDTLNANRFSLAVALAALGLFATALPAWAACTISTIGVSFGVYDVFTTTPLDSTGSVSYTCTAGSNISIILDKGGGPTFDPRQMANGAQKLHYNLYTDATRAIIWGDGTGNSQVYVNGNTAGSLVTVTIYGRVFARQDVAAGSYSSTVIAIINF